VTNLDWILVAFVGLTAIGGWRRGLIVTVLSLAGLVAGALVGSHLAPHLLKAGSDSRYTALVGLIGAVVGIGVFELGASIAGRTLRTGLHLLPPLRMVDSMAGGAIGAVWGFALVWVASAVVLQVPGYPKLHREVRESSVVHRLDTIAPPHDLLRVQSRLVEFSALLRP
jgi:uncharacterized membrane protein required for colicin V production